jgi:glycogen(starch) synthase
MKLLMLGWEFPPRISGGLGTACHGLAHALDQQGVEVLFVMPRPPEPQLETITESFVTSETHTNPSSWEIETVDKSDIRLVSIPASLSPYDPRPPHVRAAESKSQETITHEIPGETHTQHHVYQKTRVIDRGAHYAGDLAGEVQRFADQVVEIASSDHFELIHAHDWMTFKAGLAARDAAGCPLVTHVHSTELDRSGLNVNPFIYDHERQGVHLADQVIAVSHMTRNILLRHYGADGKKVRVVHNAVQFELPDIPAGPPLTREEKIVLFLGRITAQKGPEYFLRAARRVLEFEDKVRFIIAGSGDQARAIIEQAAEMGIGHRVLFTGFLEGDDVRRVFQMADLYVMPSVSEPFGIAPLEALANRVPVLISRQSGVSEVLTHVLKVDFWDTEEMANKILAVLKHPPLQQILREQGSIEVRKFTWDDVATRCRDVYALAEGAWRKHLASPA